MAYAVARLVKIVLVIDVGIGRCVTYAAVVSAPNVHRHSVAKIAVPMFVRGLIATSTSVTGMMEVK